MSFTFLSAESLRLDEKVLYENNKDYKIIDARSTSLYKEGHIKNALSFPSILTYEKQSKNGKIINPVQMHEIVERLGLDVNSSIVIYDEGEFFDAARVFWSLEVYGFNNVKLLNTGYDTWIKNKYETSNLTPKVKRSNYIPRINHNRLSTRFQTQIATKNPNQSIIDARSYEEYIGNKSSAQRFGHIPAAMHISANDNIDYQSAANRLKSQETLKELYKHVDKSKKIIIYCSIGKMASANYFALRELGYNVSNYDASWNEWGNDFSLPIISKK